MYIATKRTVILALSAVLFLGVSTQPSQAGLINPSQGDSDDCIGCGFIGINELNIVLGAWNQSVPPANPLADRSGDGYVGIDDLNWVLSRWNAGTPPGEVGVDPCDFDMSCDGFVGIDDLNVVLSLWNMNVAPGNLQLGDASGDGYVGIDDLNWVLSQWNAGTPPITNAVPEPAGFLMLSVLFGGALCTKHPR